MTVKFTNNASTTLASGINTTATSITVADASSFPSLSGADDYAYLTLQESTGTGREIVKATALSSNTFTIVRAQDNTTARTHSSGDIVELRLTSALLTDVINAATVEGIKTNFQYTPTAGQTVFTGADNSSNTLIINDSSLINVYLNGARLVQGTDYTVDVNNNRVTLASGGTTADILDIEVFGNFTGQSGAAVAITGGAITGATIDNAVIGGSTAAAGTFTTIAGALASSVTGSTQSQGSNNTLIATTAYVDTAVSNLIDSAPSSLNTLNELAAAMNDNASFFSTVLPLSGGTMTGNIAHASNFTIDVGGNITLDADNGKIEFKDGGTLVMEIEKTASDVRFYSAISDNDIKFLGNDGGSTVTALTLDISEAGAAYFNTQVGIGSAPVTGYGHLQVRNGFGYINEDGSNTKQMYLRTNYGTGNPAIQVATAHDLLFATSNTTRMTIDSSGRVNLGPDALDIQIDPASTNSGNNLLYMRGNASDDKSQIQLNHYGHADFHIGVGHVGNGKFNIANDLTGDDFVINGSGNVGIGVVPNASTNTYVHFQVARKGSGILSFANSTDIKLTGNAYYNSGWKYANTEQAAMYEQTLGKHTFFVAPSGTADSAISWNTAMIIDNSGNLLIGGGTSPRTLGFGDTRTQIEGISATTASMSIVRNTASGDPPYLIFGKSRGGALASSTVVQDGDYLGAIRFNGADGTDAGNVGAQIHAEVDGTPGANDMPGALVFSTTADGAASATERMRVATDGTTTIGRAITATYDNDQGYPLHIQASGGSQTYLAISTPGDNSGDTGVVIGHDATGTRIVNRENQPILFHTGSSSGLTFTMEAGGNLSIADGNLVVASGHGIDFSNAPNSNAGASHSTLDDYEEGSFSPTLFGGGTQMSTSGGTVLGRYTKIGNLVSIWGVVTRLDATSVSGNLNIQNLPFPIASVSGFTRLGMGWIWMDNGSGLDRIGQVYITTTPALLGVVDFSVRSGRYLNMTSLTNGRPVYFSASYQTDS